MENLIKYIENQEFDNEVLLSHYMRLGTNRNLKTSMMQSPVIRDRHIRYELWKLLPEEKREMYNQELMKVPEVGITTLIVTAGDERWDGKVENDTQEEEEVLNHPQGNDDDNDTEEEEVLNDTESSLSLEEKAKLYNERAKLSNSLHTFAEDDNAGRAAVMKQIEALSIRIKGGETPPSRQYTWLKTPEEITLMSDAEIRVYKKALSDRRGKASAAIKRGENIEKNQILLEIIDKEKQTLG
jgi:hypothetical protein